MFEVVSFPDGSPAISHSIRSLVSCVAEDAGARLAALSCAYAAEQRSALPEPDIPLSSGATILGCVDCIMGGESIRIEDCNTLQPLCVATTVSAPSENSGGQLSHKDGMHPRRGSTMIYHCRRLAFQSMLMWHTGL